MADYKDRIRKLLALSKSSNEHEAKAALVRARKLMAEHKLEMSDLDAESAEVVMVKTDISFTTNSLWIHRLVKVIAANHCCAQYTNHKYRAKSYRVGLIGFQDDVDACLPIFEYAVDSVQARINQIKDNYWFAAPAQRRSMADGYAYGFIEGLQNAYEEQNRVEESKKYELVLSVPAQVSQFCKEHLVTGRTLTQKSYYSSYYNEGRKDGQNFGSRKRVTSEDDDPLLLL